MFKGEFAGDTLSSLSDGELLQLLDELRATDPQGAFLIKVHIGRRSQDRYGRHPESLLEQLVRSFRYQPSSSLRLSCSSFFTTASARALDLGLGRRDLSGLRTNRPVGNPRSAPRASKWNSTTTAATWRDGVSRANFQAGRSPH